MGDIHEDPALQEQVVKGLEGFGVGVVRHDPDEGVMIGWEDAEILLKALEEQERLHQESGEA